MNCQWINFVSNKYIKWLEKKTLSKQNEKAKN